MALVAAVTMTGAVVGPATAADEPTTYYLDCSAPTEGPGTVDQPLASIEAANELELGPGDQLLLRRGTTCHGELAPTGQGTAEQPIVVGDYGDAAGRAVVDADGATNAVLLRNNAHLHLTDLELVAPGDNLTARRGVYVYGEDGGALEGVRVEGLYIHDVRGELPYLVEPGHVSSFAGKGVDASGGIVVDAMGSEEPTAFHDLTIVNNRIDDVDREGIYFWSNWCRREALNRWGDMCFEEWFPHRDVLVAGNYLTDVGGDGLVITGTVGATVEHNTLEGFNRRAGSYNAGIWTANSDDVLMQYNTATGGYGLLDSQAFDIDHATHDVTLRYNLSYDNDGGFFLSCPDTYGVHGFRVHDNISINDGARTFQHGCGGPIYDGKIFNNTFYIGDGVSTEIWQDTGQRPDVEIFNNIFVSEGAGDVVFTKPADGLTIHDNLITGFAAPAGATGTVTGDAELFNPGTRDAADYRLAPGSAALAAGVDVDVALDYFENPYPASSPNLGAYQGPALERTTANGCVPLLELPARAAVVDGEALTELTVRNECVDEATGLTLEVVTPSGLSSATDGTALDPVASGADLTVPLAVTVGDDVAAGEYPVAVRVRSGDDVVASGEVTVVVDRGWTTELAEDFDAMTAGEAPAGWTVTGARPPQVVAGEDGNVLRLDRATDLVSGVWDFGAQELPTRVSVLVRADQTNAALGVHLLDASGAPVARASLADLGVVSYTDGQTFINTGTAYEADTWYLLELTVDDGRYTLTMDGRPVGEGATTGDGVPARLRVQIPTSVSVESSFLVDDIRVATFADDDGGTVPQYPAPEIDPDIDRIRPAEVTAGRSAGIDLSGFRPGENVRVTAGGSAAFGVTEPDGTLTVAVPLPADTASGQLQVTAVQDTFGEELRATGTVTVAGTQQEEPTCSEDFEGMTPGESPAGWTVSGNPAPVVVDEDGNHVLSLSRQQGASDLISAVCDFGPQSAEGIVLRAEVRAEGTTSALGVHWLDANGNPVVRLSMNMLGTWSYTDGATFIDTDTPYAADRWYTLDAVLSGSTYTVLVDGEEIGSGAVGSSQAPAQLRVQIPPSSTSATSFAVDNIVIGAETEEPTEEPTTEEPTTEEPTTEEPTTEEPTTEEPTTEEPTTEEPTTEEPTTEEPTTEEPTTEEPTTEEPTTEEPTTEEPTTEEPTTEEPTTEEPTSEEPTTEEPTTEEPTTEEPTPTQTTAPGDATGPDDDAPGGALPDTGADVGTAALVVLGLLVAGGVLLARRHQLADPA